MISFRKGGLPASRLAGAASSSVPSPSSQSAGAPSAAASGQSASANSAQSVSLEWWQTPNKYRKRAIDELEIEAINVSGLSNLVIQEMRQDAYHKLILTNAYFM